MKLRKNLIYACLSARHIIAGLLICALVLLSGCGIQPSFVIDASPKEPAAVTTPQPVSVSEDSSPADSHQDAGSGKNAPQAAVSSPTQEITATTPQKPEETQPAQTPEETQTAQKPQDTQPVQTPEPTGQKELPEGQPPTLARMVNTAGLRFEDFDFSELILVVASGSAAEVYCYDKDDKGHWAINENISYIDGRVGRSGVSLHKTEGDGCTPEGIYSLGFAFGNAAKPETEMDYRPVTKNSYWVDDPDSEYYNQWVEGNTAADWTSAEHLSDAKASYAYAVVVDYNTLPNIIGGAGSAIFLHCGNKSTSGCIAVPEDSLLDILKWLSPGKKPHILICMGR